MRVWYNRDGTEDPNDEESEYTIALSEAFHEEIDRHKIPIERRVVAALANAPGILDLYVWLVWRTWSLEAGRQARVPLPGITGLIQQLGSKEYSRERDFRQKLAKWMREVRAWWPECPATISPDGRFLILSSAKKAPAIHSNLIT
jgi:Plasmid encoded RepA protein